MKNILLASTSSLFGEDYLQYLKDELKDLFKGIDEIVFVPYARASGLTHDEYTQKVADFFATLNIKVTGLHTFDNPKEGLNNAKAYFTGGGNTFLLVKQLHDLGLMQVLKEEILKGKPYLGTSAGSNIGGVNMCTTNDMPIVYPPSFETMALMPYNLNPHYLDPLPELKHNGETRETRINEFHTQNDIPVIGLREGSWLRIKDSIELCGKLTARIFAKGNAPYELTPGLVSI